MYLHLCFNHQSAPINGGGKNIAKILTFSRMAKFIFIAFS